MVHHQPAHFESNPFKVIFNGFDRLFKYNQTMGIILIVFSLLGTVWQFMSYAFDAVAPADDSTGQTLDPAWVAVIVVGILFLAVISIVLGIMINGFMAFVAHKTAKAETTTFGEAVNAVWDKFWIILWVQIIVFFKIVGGILLFVIPGIRAALRYNMVLLPVFDENASAKHAIAKSKTVTKDHLIEIFGMSVAAGIIPFIGQVMLVGGQSVMYPQLVALQASGGPKPKVHWLNYLAFILVAAFVLFILMIFSVVLLLAA